jgi:predicted outer membrane repeat protein
VFVTIRNSEFSQNEVRTNGGGALSLTAMGDVLFTIINCSFHDNIATRSGGAIFAKSIPFQNVQLFITSSMISKNRAHSSGGIDIFGDVIVSIKDTILSNNNATAPDSSGNGGAISVLPEPISWSANAALTMSGVVFEGNRADQHGGACFVVGLLPTRLVLTNSIWRNNHAAQSKEGVGGAFVMEGNWTGPDVACKFEGNTASVGAAIYWHIPNQHTDSTDDRASKRPAWIHNCVFHDNHASLGVGDDLASSPLWIDVIWANKSIATTENHAIYLDSASLPNETLVIVPYDVMGQPVVVQAVTWAILDINETATSTLLVGNQFRMKHGIGIPSSLILFATPPG